MTFWVTAWLRAFGLTLLVEVPIAIWLLAMVDKRPARRVAIVVLANLATHPLVWFLFPGLALGSAARFALSEAWAVGAETAVYTIVWPALPVRRAALVSLIANASSVAVGLILRRLGAA